MAYYTKQQVREIIDNAPPNLDKRKLIEELAKTNQLEGYNEQPAEAPVNNGQELGGEQPEKQGFLSSVVSGITAPFRKVAGSGVRALQATPDIIRAIGGNEEANIRAQQTMATPILGSKTLAGSSNLENLGSAASIGSFLVPGGKVIGGMVGGGIGAGGATLEEGGSFTDALKSGAFGAATGGLLTKYAPGIAKKLFSTLPESVQGSISKGVNEVGETTTKPFNQVYNAVVRKPAKALLEPKLTSSIAKSNEKILNLTKTELNKQALSGKNLAKFLADEQIPIKIEDGKILGLQTIESFKPTVQTENAIFNGLLETEPKVVSIDEIANKALSKLKSTGIDLNRAKAYLGQQVEALVQQAPENSFFTANGKLYGNLKAWNGVKSKVWGSGINFANPDANIISDANNALGHSILDIIDNNVDDIDVKAIGRRLGDWQDAITVLSKKEGTKVPPARISNLFNRVLGGVIGTSAGGPAGGVAGALGAEKVAAIFSNPEIQQDIKYSILKELQSTPEGSAIIQQAEKIYGQRMKDIAGRIALPPQSTIFAPDKYQNAPNKGAVSQVVEANRVTQRNPSTGRMQRIYTTEGRLKKVKQVETPNLKVVDDTLNQEARKYKSAEEFVKAQGKPVYHGSPYAGKIETEGFKLGKSENLVNAFGRGTYLTTDRSYASAYAGLPEKGGGVVKAYLPKDLKLKKAYDRDAYKINTAKLIEEGYQGIELVKPSGKNHLTIFDPSAIKTKSQLTDIWKKANKK